MVIWGSGFRVHLVILEKENGNYFSKLRLHRDNEKENGNYSILELQVNFPQAYRLGLRV